MFFFLQVEIIIALHPVHLAAITDIEIMIGAQIVTDTVIGQEIVREIVQGTGHGIDQGTSREIDQEIALGLETINTNEGINLLKF